MSNALFKSIQHNIGVLAVGFIFTFIGIELDTILKLHNFKSVVIFILGVSLLTIGFVIRLWATYYFYKVNLRVIDLKPQKKLITNGPFKYSRNPLYLGGNVFMFLGSSLIIGTVMGVVLTFAHLSLVNFMIKREEKQLENTFGKQWSDYKKRTRRWI